MDIEKRLEKAKSTSGRLKRIWNSRKYSKKTKIKLYYTLVKPVLTYKCETWKINTADNERLDSSQYKCLKKIMGIYWPYIISKKELIECCSATG